MQSPRLSVRRGRRLTVSVSAAHAWWGILEPIKDPVDALGHLSDQYVEFIIRRELIDHLLKCLLNQRNQSLAFCCNQIDHMAVPVLSFLRALRDPLIEPFDEIRGTLNTLFLTIIYFQLVSDRNCSNSPRNSSIGPTLPSDINGLMR